MHYYKVKGGIVAVISPIDDAEEITKEEYIQLKSAINPLVWTEQMQERYERTRPLTADEVARMLIDQQINSITVDDNTALRMLEFYPEWATDTDYAAGFKVQYGGKLYKCLTAHTSQADWTPDAAPSLWAKVLIPDPEVIPEWEQPGSTNPYMAGDKVQHNGKTWVSTVDNNVWAPGVFGWTEVPE